MTTETKILTDAEIFHCFDHWLAEAVINFDADELYPVGRAIEQAVLQSPEVQRLRKIEKAAQSVLDWTHVKHCPPVREAIPKGEMTWVRVHALADLHDALHPDSPTKTPAMEKQP